MAAGAIAKKILRLAAGVEILAYVQRVQDVEAQVDPSSVTAEQVEANIVRCPNPEAAAAMIEKIEAAAREGDSLGGVVECVARNVPRGLGCPVFDKLEADLAKAVMSLPASKGFEIGSGFAGTYLTGKQHNDEFYMTPSGWRTRSNRSGGIQGASATGKISSCGWPSSPLPPFASLKTRSLSTARRRSWWRGGATIPACCRGRCRW